MGNDSVRREPDDLYLARGHYHFGNYMSFIEFGEHCDRWGCSSSSVLSDSRLKLRTR
jgi:hypothetical protein